MTLSLVRLSLEDVSGEYDPVIVTLFVDDEGQADSKIETFGYWGRAKRELWPFRLIAGDAAEASVDFGFSEGDDPYGRFGKTNLRSKRIVEGELATFSYQVDEWTVAIKKPVILPSGEPFHPRFRNRLATP